MTKLTSFNRRSEDVPGQVRDNRLSEPERPTSNGDHWRSAAQQASFSVEILARLRQV
jgi:hypothetical protein